MSGTYKIDDELFPLNPLSVQWKREQLGTSGIGVPMFADVWQVEMRFGILDAGEFDWFMSRTLAGGLHSVVLPHPSTWELTQYTGVSIMNLDGVRQDVIGYVHDSNLLFGNIHLNATGTA